jgi:hypothetical protein
VPLVVQTRNLAFIIPIQLSFLFSYVAFCTIKLQTAKAIQVPDDRIRRESIHELILYHSESSQRSR